MFAIDAMKRTVWLLAFVATALAACSRGSSTGATSASPTVQGVYAVDGASAEYLVLQEHGRFCFMEQGLVTVGTYEVHGTSLTLTPDVEGLGPQTGTIDGDVVTDPDGMEWVRSTEIDPSSCEAATHASPLPSLLDELADQIASPGWPRDVDEAKGALERLPRSIGGYRAASPHPVGAGSGTIVATFPDPKYPGPVSGVSVLVLRVPASLTPSQLVDATAHMGFALRNETKRLDVDETVPLVVGEIAEVEGAGSLPTGHVGYLAVWSTRDGHAAYAVIADGLRSLAGGIEALEVSVSGGSTR
jgi:hypothetical protein